MGVPPPNLPEDVADEYEDPGYRIVSVSQDSQLAFWEFTTDGVATPSNRIVMPVGSTAAEGGGGFRRGAAGTDIMASAATVSALVHISY
jgi:hypothetical protein